MIALGAIFIVVGATLVMAKNGDNRGFRTYATEGVPGGDYKIEFTFTVEKPYAFPPSYFGEDFRNYKAGRNEGWWDFMIAVREQDADHHYRILVSAKEQKIALWKPEGGFLAVADAPIGLRTPHEMDVSLVGNTIAVSVGGHEQFSYVDQINPVLEGAYTISKALDAEAHVSNVRSRLISKQEANIASSPELHEPDFTIREWRGRSWIFDGLEPIAHVDTKKLMLHDVKLTPGYKPLVYWELFWKQYKGKDMQYANVLDGDIDIDAVGEKLVLRMASKTNAGEITSREHMVVSYDDKRDTYVYDVSTEVEINPGKTWEYHPEVGFGFEYLNILAYNAVAPADKKIKDQWHAPYSWVMYDDITGAIYRQPLNHSPDTYTAHINQNGGVYGIFSNEPISPAIQIFKDENKELQGNAQLCKWAYDIHFRYLPYTDHKEKIIILPAGEKYSARYQVFALDVPAQRKMFSKSILDPVLAKKQGIELPIYQRGVNDFRIGRKQNEPHPEWVWQGEYEWDRTTGHDDSSSLKIVGIKGQAKDAFVDTAGSSYFTRHEARPAGTYTMSVYVRGEPGSSGIVSIGIQSKHPENKPAILEIPFSGKSDEWQKLEFSAYLPENTGIKKFLRFEGEGTVWFDNERVVGPDSLPSI